jgi:porphobilinogen synthase
MNFYRGHRTRHSETIRNLVRETRVDVSDLIFPLFVTEEAAGSAINAMPGQKRYSLKELPAVAEEIVDLGIPGVLLFGIPIHKDAQALAAHHPCGIVQKAVQILKQAQPHLCVITDVCLCEYTSHGHCGILNPEGHICNDASIETLAQIALSHAQAGADIVAPSDMMDGRVQAIREKLDTAQFQNVPIMSYAAKYASAFYGPFREAAGSTPQFGNRKGYQMDPANAREAMREIDADINEGADFIIVKPALSYLDIVAKARERTNVPIAAYNVSGEYSMVKLASQNGFIDEKNTVLEILTSLKRAGANLIITYHALDAARWIRGDRDL